MANDKGKGFPKIAQANWFGLRDKFKQRVPAEVTSSYVASALNMAEGSARSNVIAPLKALGIINEDGKPTDLAYEWRDDSKYKQACEAIVREVYPQELHDLFPDPNSPPEDLVSWFMRTAKVGSAAARMYSQTYLMLLEADPARGNGAISARTVDKPASPKTPRMPASAKATRPQPSHAEGDTVGDSQVQSGTNQKVTSSLKPSLHIDIQIHISPESGAEQIDKIFQSMAKHLKDFEV